jgi:hypothetical protein
LTGESGRKGSGALSREERLAAALRENLKRRKAQGRGRTVQEEPGRVGQDESAEDDSSAKTKRDGESGV